MNVLFGNEKWHQAAALYVRMQVFVLERGIRLTEEFDLDDHDKTDYVVIYDENKPVATGRYKQMDAETIRPGRIAVLKDYRNRGLGQQIIEELEKAGLERGAKRSIIHGELTAAAFYEKLGYKKCSEEYLEDSVPCVTLEKQFVQ
ncbi:GNAT family N-acetyltransferase [Marinilactibacillus sp. XAAS-LB27]|uniref:GNAT family N-acetyltransferase n=1 Tax=Marinilactibacillus sp. XAAS-LB27 TaxID=3114538 RepID=UPI002E18AC2F|nr:GNAT family N-acetyltransferase [Marinilactibacillus sp. XAAS-LB27]